MTWNYVFTPNIWPSVFTVLLLIALFLYSWRRHSIPGALPFSFGCMFAALWASGSAMEIVAMDMGTKIFWAKFQAACQMPVATAVTCFLLEYAWPGRWLTRRSLVLLSLPCLLALGLVFTNDFHHLAWRGFEFDGSILPQPTPLGWIIIAYGLVVLGTINILVFAWLFLRSSQQRWPVVVMLAGLVGGRLTYLLERASIVHAVFPLDLLGMAFEFLMYAIALFGFRILDPIPLARRTAIDQLHSGMLVLDPQGRVVSLNQAAEEILGVPARQIKGQPIGTLLLAYPDESQTVPSETEINLSLGVGREIRNYMVETSLLKDWRGLEVGHLLLLHDITELKQAQAQLLEQQRALAMLHEREQLARELHDSIGQVLGFASLMVGATRKLIADQKLAKADAQLARMEHIMADAHADVREYILNLRTSPTEEQPFFSILQSYLNGFRQNYGIQVDVSIEPGVDNGVFTPEAQMQLFRILQEALSNVRKHAETKCVRVSFEIADSLLRICVQDNGRGFDRQHVTEAGDSHFGLSFMGERAEGLGGTLRVDSTPGAGTCVIVEVPVEG